MAKMLMCPCGEPITARDEEFLDKVRAHLASAHPGLSYPDEAIMSMASDFNDADLTD